MSEDMSTSVSNFTHRYKFWFYFRKGLFQILFPILLAFMTFCDFVKQSGQSHNSYAYYYLYFYTSLILFLYSGMNRILEFIFSLCADDIIFKKEINLSHTTPQLLISSNLAREHDGPSCEHYIIIVKKIFKLRYSKSLFFAYVTTICWFLGIDCPILIPNDIAKKLGNIKNNLTIDNEDSFMRTTLTNLYSYHPRFYEVTPIIDEDYDENLLDSLEDGLVPKRVITKMDKTICDMQKELFNKENDIDFPNVV